MYIDDQIGGMNVYGSIRIYPFSCVEQLSETIWNQVRPRTGIFGARRIDDHTWHRIETLMQPIRESINQNIRSPK